MSRAESAPHRLGAAAISAAYEAGTLTPTVLVRHLLDRAGRMDPQVHAFIRLDAEAALDAAAQAEREIAAGRKRGPLHLSLIHI